MATKTPTALRNEAATLNQKAAALLAKRDELLSAAEAQESVLTLEPGTIVKATRRVGTVVDATFTGAKATERGILVAVQVGEGFDAEVLRLPLSKVEVPATNPSETTSE